VRALTPAVLIQSLNVSFKTASGTFQALESVDLTVKENEFLTLIGPSGCGKTTVLRCIAHLVDPTSGQVTVNGLSPIEAIQKRDVGYVFQSATLLEWRNVLKNVLLPMEIAGVGRKEASRRASEMIERVGLTDFVRNFPRQLSGGMQQRVAIARALVMEPKIILMDEPFAALDEITREDMNRWLMEVFDKSNTTIVFVTHNIREAIMLSDRVVVMAPRPGRLVAEFEIDLPRPRTQEIMFSEEFNTIRQQAEQELFRSAHQTTEGNQEA
jgi:NitT/TauT family transport system ATP-binding protein|tara:strand:- start:843 stop:1649 length:807 start_codon:yes stop_codon:yes gene_type:complete